LFIEWVRQLADDPLAQPAARGVPIGDGCGMQAALWDILRSGPKSFTLRDWFTVNAI